MPKYIIDIPAQTIEIEAPTGEEAADILLEDGLFNFYVSEKSKKQQYTFPESGRPVSYYIDRLYKNTVVDTWFDRTYIRDGNMAYFTDGRRIYRMSSKEDVSMYEDRTEKYSERINDVKPYFEGYGDGVTPVKIDFKQLLKDVERMDERSGSPRYNIAVHNVIHSVNSKYLLDALMFTGADEIKVGNKPDDFFLMEGPDGRTAVVLPMLYEGTDPFEIDQSDEM